MHDLETQRIRIETRADAITALTADLAQLDSFILLLQFRGCGLRTMNGLQQMQVEWFTHIEEMKRIQAAAQAQYDADANREPQG